MKTICYNNIFIFIPENENELSEMRKLHASFGNESIYQGKTLEHLRILFDKYKVDDPGCNGIYEGAKIDHSVM